MPIHISWWGNSLALRIPKSVAEAAGVKAGDAMIIRCIESGEVLITPVNGPVAIVGHRQTTHKPVDLKDW
jgi:antitoxin component of MazEF toxin-antitoxin module